jgi:phosphatidylglycerophosphate synthase
VTKTDFDASGPDLAAPPAPPGLTLQGRAGAALALALLGAGGAIALVLPQAGIGAAAVALGGLGLGGGAMLRGLATSYPYRRFGLANAITLSRAAGVAVLAAALFAPPAEDAARWALTALALLILALDGLDGWAARRTGLACAFGARFDVEVDTAFALILALLVWQSGAVGPWVVVLGLFRPAFLLAGRLWPPLTAPLPEAYWRKTVCVIQIGALIALVSPVMPAPLAPALAALVLALLLVSFARDVAWLARHRQG